MEWKMFRFVHGRQSMNEAVHHHPVQAQRTMQYHRAFYGCLIMLCPDAQAVKRNFGSAGENIIAGSMEFWIFFFNFWNSFTIFFTRIAFLLFRSCGHIFCADCSEYWAALPDERLFTPVRLCASCYNLVTSKCQVSA